MPKDYYEILGINKGATEDDIKRAYRKLAQKHHPDRNKGDKASEEKFKEANKAYEVLSDKQKRQTYDQFGDAAFAGGSPGQGGGFSGFDFSGVEGFGENFGDIFETFFGAGQTGNRRHGKRAGDDRETAVEIGFEEAAFGAEREIRIDRISVCGSCSGSGAASGSRLVKCGTCHGSGEIRVVKSTLIGQMSTRRVCEMCEGSGEIPEKKCAVCNGLGRVRIVDKLRMRIPAGIGDGSTIRIVGKGDSGGRGGEVGDLYVHIRVTTHNVFTRKGFDVYSDQEIALVQAVLGDTVKIKTLHGDIPTKIPAGTQSERVVRLKGYGIQKLKGEGRGDHFVTIKVRIPEKLSSKEKELFKELAKESGFSPEKEKGFFKKVMGS